MTDNKTPDFDNLRRSMVRDQLRSRRIMDQAVLNAMNTVPREHFVLSKDQQYAYEDRPLLLPENQTISQPYMVAYMLEALQLQPTDHVLEVGAGSGYVAALLAHIVCEVYAIERHEKLVQYAQKRLDELGIQNVQLCCGDGTLGWPDQAPFDAIVVSACGRTVPEPLHQQLAIDGRLVIPVELDQEQQQLLRVERKSDTRYITEYLGGVAFVPLIGEKA